MTVQKTKLFAGFFLLALLSVTCTKENFTEPPDPFVEQRLDPNPARLTLGEGPNALTLETNEGNVTETTEGRRIKGTLYIKNDTFGDVKLSNGDFFLTAPAAKDSGGGLYFNGFKGQAIISLPEEGLLKNLTIPGITAAPVGFQKGSEFEAGPFAWPVDPERYYFFYENLNPFPVNITNSSLENIKKIAIDPADPFFFAVCDFNGTPLGDISDAGVAVSVQGLIPFTPLIEESYFPMPNFTGNLYITGNIPLGEYPASFTGETVLAFDSETEGASDDFFAGKSTNFILGLNGQVNFEHDALDWMGIDVTLGQATLEFAMEKSGHTYLRFIGERTDPPMSVSDFINEIIAQDWNFLDYLAPYEQKEVFYGSIGNELSDWSMGFRFSSKLNLPGNYTIDMGHVFFYVDPNVLNFSGEAVIAGFSRFGLNGTVERNGHFEFTGYQRHGFDAHWHSLSLDFHLDMDASLKYDGSVTFKGRVKLKGDACVKLGKVHICAGFTIRTSVTISSNGHFEVCFSIGIGKLGYDVCLDFDPAYETVQGYRPNMRYVEIPLEDVPAENRFQPYE